MYDRHALEVAGYRVETREQSAFPSAIEELQPVLILFCCYVINKDITDFLSTLTREPVPVLVLAVCLPPEQKRAELLPYVHMAKKQTSQDFVSLVQSCIANDLPRGTSECSGGFTDKKGPTIS